VSTVGLLLIQQLVIATAVGVAFGPVGAKWFPEIFFGDEEAVTREFCRIVIAIQVMAAGVALPKAYLRKEIVSLSVLLIPGMIWMWLSSSLLVWWLIPGLNFVSFTYFSLRTKGDKILTLTIA
jgi:NhaP-type Na+/H+ or K+/H+ antiporter